jgi:Sugar transferases involved in lipopolysaccharide synthesis
MKSGMMLIRTLDMGLSLVAIILLSPVMLAIAVAIWSGDRGPILFRQIRVGRDCRPFVILKFRSMLVSDSNDSSSQGTVTEADIAEARRKFRTTVRNDPRITPVGRLLRSSHLDELPQFFNVLRGDMSLVGVRPDTPSQEADYEPAYWVERHALRPGITGPAQIGPTDGGLADRTALERQWLRAPNLRTYLIVLGRTIGKVVNRSSF